MAQMDPEPAFDQRLIDRAIAFLQTRDTRLFPFAERFDEAQLRAFVHDLRVGLSDLTESGSKRGTSASGFIVSDQRLQDIIDEWSAAGGSWPAGSDPRDPFTALTVGDPEEEEVRDIDTISGIDPSIPVPPSR